MVGGTVALAQFQSVGNGHGDIMFGIGHRFRDGFSQRKVCGNGGRKGAAGAVGIFGSNPFGGIGIKIRAIKEKDVYKRQQQRLYAYCGH